MTRKSFAPARILSVVALSIAVLTLLVAPGTAQSCESHTILTASSNPSSVEAQVAFTAQLIAKAYCNGVAQECNGNMSFYEGTTSIGSARVGGPSCSATISDSSLTVGNHEITVFYSGGFPPNSTRIIQTVDPYPTTTTLTSALNPSIYGQPVSWTATTVSQEPGNVPPPTGTVSLVWNGTIIVQAPLTASGIVTLTRANFNADSYPLTAVYSGDAYNGRSTSPVLNQVVEQTTSSATLTSSPNPSAQGESVTFTAQVLSPSAAATGPVTFAIGKTVLGTAQLAGSIANFTTSALPLGSTTVTATYYGDSNIAKSSATVTQTVH